MGYLLVGCYWLYAGFCGCLVVGYFGFRLLGWLGCGCDGCVVVFFIVVWYCYVIICVMFTRRVDGMMVVFVLNSVVLVFLYLKLDVFGSAWYRFGLFCCNVAVVWVLGYLWVCVSIVLCAY